MWNFIKYLLSGALAIIGFMLTITPTEAKAHLSEWFILIGISDLPSWLSDKNIENWIILIGVFFTAIGIFFILFLLKIKKKYFPKSRKNTPERLSEDVSINQQSIGFKANGGTIKDCDSLGYDVGFDTTNTEQSGNRAIAPNSFPHAPSLTSDTLSKTGDKTNSQNDPGPSGGIIQDSLSIGFDVGFNTANTEQARNYAVAPNSFLQFPPPTGEFTNLKNEELKNEMIKLADYLASLGYGLENNDKIKKTLPHAASLTSEAFKRTGNIPNSQNDLGPSGGAVIVLSGNVTGAFPAICTCRFLRLIAEHL